MKTQDDYLLDKKDPMPLFNANYNLLDGPDIFNNTNKFPKYLCGSLKDDDYIYTENMKPLNRKKHLGQCPQETMAPTMPTIPPTMAPTMAPTIPPTMPPTMAPTPSSLTYTFEHEANKNFIGHSGMAKFGKGITKSVNKDNLNLALKQCFIHCENNKMCSGFNFGTLRNQNDIKCILKTGDIIKMKNSIFKSSWKKKYDVLGEKK